MPVVAYPADVQQAVAASGTSMTVNAPTNLVLGNLIIVSISTLGPATPTLAPFGFTLIGYAGFGVGNPAMQCWWKIATFPEPAMYTFTQPVSQRWRIVSARYSGVNQVSPINTFSVNNSLGVAVTSHTFAPMTTTADNTMFVGSIGGNSLNASSPNYGLHTQLFFNGATPGIQMGYVQVPAAGGISGQVYSWTGSALVAAVAVAINEAVSSEGSNAIMFGGGC